MDTLTPQKGLRVTYALQSRSFAVFWLGQTISALGDGAFATALAVAVYQLTGSSLAMGLFLMAQIFPELIFTLFGGIAADRLPRRLILVGSDAGRALIVLCIALLSWFGLLQLWHLFVLAVLFGIIGSFFHPAYRAITPELVVQAHLSSANALTELSIQMGNLLGPILGAGLIAYGGSTGTAFAFDSLTFIISVCSLAALHVRTATKIGAVHPGDDEATHPGDDEATHPGDDEATHPGDDEAAHPGDDEAHSAPENRGEKTPMHASGFRGMIEDMRDGFQTITRSSWLLCSMIVAAFGLMAYRGAMSVSLPKLVFAVYGSGPWLLGIITTMVGVGAIAGALFVGQAHLRRRGIIALLGYVLSGLALLIFSLPLPHTIVPFVVLPAAFLVGFGINVMQIIWVTLLYELVPSDKLGRVSSVDLLGSLSLLPIGYVLAGWLGDKLGPPAVFLLAGIVMVVLNLLPLLLKDIRKVA